MNFLCCCLTSPDRTRQEETALPDTDQEREKVQSTNRRYIASRGRNCAVLLSCIMQLVIVGGIAYGLSVMYVELVIVFDAKRADAAWVQSLYTGLSCASGILFSGLIRRFGEGVCIVLGGTLSGIGLFLSAFADGLLAIILCTGLFAGFTMGICFLSAYTTTGKMFTENSSFYLISLTFGISLGQFIVPLLFETFIERYSWTGAFILIAGISLQCVPCGVVIHYSKRYFQKLSTRKPGSSNAFFDKTLLTDGIIWILFLIVFLITVTGNVEAWFIVDHMVSRGFARESGSITVSVLGIGNCIGRIVGALLRFRFVNISTVNHWIYLSIINALIHVVVINLYDVTSILITCFMCGIVFGTLFSQTPAIMFEETGAARYPQGMALLNIIIGLGDVVGPLLGGFIKDISGAYEILFYMSSGVGVSISLTTCIVSLWKRRRHREYSS